MPGFRLEVRLDAGLEAGLVLRPGLRPYIRMGYHSGARVPAVVGSSLGDIPYLKRQKSMPCATIHMLLADRVLADWENTPGRAPIPVHRPGVRAAFLHGAVAPDMGFVPRADRFISELAHYHSPADLTRALLRHARTQEAEAFAWGWATHVLGDVDIHPIIGRGVGEVLYGDRHVRVDAAHDVTAHVSLEVGLDIHYFRSHPGASFPSASTRLDTARILQVEGALAEVYGLRFDRTDLIGQNRRALRMIEWWPWALGVLSNPTRAGRGLRARARRGILPRVLSGLRAVSRYGSAARGFFTPGMPAEWLVREVDRTIETFPARFQAVVQDGLASLENRNLETGGPAGPGRNHPASDQIAARLASLRKRGITSYFPGPALAG